MAIFNSVFESTSVDILEAELESANIYTPDMNGEVEDGDNIVAEFCRDMYMLEASMYVADVQLETAVSEGANIEATMENFLTDAVATAKKKVLELWEKLQKWFKEMISKFRAFTAASASFVKKHSNEIMNNYKKNTDWKYSGYKYNEAAFTAADGAIDKIRDSAYSKADSSNGMDIDIAMANVGKSFKGADGIDASTYQDIETGSVAALGTVIMGACRGTEADDEHPAEDVVQGWINTCREAEKTLNKLNAHEAEAKKQISKIIAELKKAEKEAKKSEKGKDDKSGSTSIHNTIKFNTKLAAIVSKVTTVIVNARIEQFKAYSRRLREIKGLKGSDKKKEENTETAPETAPAESAKESFNLLNNAFGLF